jgi:hypothetical protein
MKHYEIGGVLGLLGLFDHQPFGKPHALRTRVVARYSGVGVVALLAVDEYQLRASDIVVPILRATAGFVGWRVDVKMRDVAVPDIG